MDDEDGGMRPRIIDTSRYVKDRIDQIAGLLEANDGGTGTPNSLPTSSEAHATACDVTQREATTQINPSYRRRVCPSPEQATKPTVEEKAISSTQGCSSLLASEPAASANISLLPVKRINRLKRKHVWLETHIWHAKRFRMEDLWGYKLPIASYQRGFRPTYRDSVHSTCIIDQSYLHCLQIVVEDTSLLDEIVGRLNQLCAPTVAPTFGFKPALDGGMEVGTLLYKPGSYPRGFIGPAVFSWSTTVTEERWGEVCARVFVFEPHLVYSTLFSSGAQSRQLQLWTHPSTQPLITTTLLELLNVKIAEKDSEELYTKRYEGAGFKIYDLRQRLARFQLIGPKALETLSSALRLVKNSELDATGLLSAFGSSHGFWREFASSLQPANLRSGSVISLLVEDPRTYRSNLLSRSTKDARMQKPVARSCSSEAPAPSHRFWSAAFRREQWERRMSSVELQAHQSKCLGRVPSQSKIPVLVVVKSSAANSLTGSNPLNRVDLVVPGGWGLDFWLALQFSNARAAGLRDKLHLDFEAGMVNFPADYPDSSTGETYHTLEAQSLEAKHRKKPGGKRISYASRLHVKFPFSFNWTHLADEWAGEEFGGESQAPYVLRDRQLLTQLSKWWDGKAKEKPGEVFVSHGSRALVQVRLKLLARGSPKRLALICLPSEEDVSAIRENRRVVIPEVATGSVGEETGQDSPWLANPSKVNVLVSLDEMFPDRELREVRRRAAKRQKRSKRRRTVKQKRRGEEGTATTAQDDGVELMEVDEGAYKDSCSRTIVGRVVRADYSFSNGQGIAYGYVPLKALDEIGERDPRLVLLRNTSSKYYHPARLSVMAWCSVLP